MFEQGEAQRIHQVAEVRVELTTTLVASWQGFPLVGHSRVPWDQLFNQENLAIMT